MVAGAMNNFILAVIILLLIATFVGAPNLDPIIGSVETGGPAEQAGLEAGDRVTRINNDKVSTTDDLAIFLQLADMSKPVTFYVTKEDGTETTYEVTPIAEEVDGTTTYRIGVTIDNEVRHDVLSVLSYTARKTGSLFKQMIISFQALFTGRVGFDQLSGPVGIYQIVGAGTMELDSLNEGDYIHDFVGPLGVPTHTEGLKKVAVVGGGVGCAIAYPITKKLHQMGAEVHAIVGFRNQDLVILEDEFKAASDKLVMMTDDGSYGEKGLVTDALEKLIQDGNEYDEVIAIGPLIMMKFVCLTTKKYDVKTVVSMNPIMIDGTGMCGGCRLTVGGETKFACVDGPDFDGHLVDFDEAMHRGTMYKEFETHARDEYCNLLKKGEN